MNVVSIKTLVLDYSRPTLYEVAINPPAALGEGEDETGGGGFVSDLLSAISYFIGAERQVNLNCRRTSFPPASFSTFENKTIGPLQKFPYEYLYEDFDMEFYLDDNHTERNFFLEWMNKIKNPKTNNFGYKDHYSTRIEIIQKDRLQLNRYKVVLVEAYPISVGEVQLAYDQTDTVNTFNVTFAYTYWYKEVITNPSDVIGI